MSSLAVKIVVPLLLAVLNSRSPEGGVAVWFIAGFICGAGVIAFLCYCLSHLWDDHMPGQ